MTPYHPASDGLVERFNRTLFMLLAMFVGEHRDAWDDLLPAVMMAYRSSVQESTWFSPYRLMFGEECTLPMDVGLPRRDQDLPDPIKKNQCALGMETLGKFFPPWTVSWEFRSAALQLGVSGVATDVRLFRESGCRLVH